MRWDELDDELDELDELEYIIEANIIFVSHLEETKGIRMKFYWNKWMKWK